MAAPKKAAFTVTDKRRGNIPTPEAPKIKAVPLGSKVLVWRVPEEQGVIELADSAKEKPLECVILAVSTTGLSEFDTAALALLKKDDKVLIRKNSGTEVKVEGHEITCLHVMDILLKL
jgi:chaperonin GroES